MQPIATHPQAVGLMPEASPPVVDSLALLGEWRAFMRARDMSDKTIHDYSYGLWRLLDHTDFTVHLLDVDEGHVVRFLADLGKHSPSKSEYAKGIRAFFKWSVRRGYRLINPIDEDVMPRRAPPAPMERFEVSELTRLLIAAAWRDQRRAWAILACMGLGCRRSEFVAIRLDDINWDRMVLQIRGENAKGRKARSIDIGPWAADAIAELAKLSTGDRLLAIQPSTMNEWVKQAARDCGFPAGRKQRVHTLRSSFASFLLDENVPVHVVAGLLGHANIKTTSGYAVIGQHRSTRAAVSVLGPGLQEVAGAV